MAIAYSAPEPLPPKQILQQWLGVAKYLSRTGQGVTRSQLQQKLGLGDRTLQIGLQSLTQLGFSVTPQAPFLTQDRGQPVEQQVHIGRSDPSQPLPDGREPKAAAAIAFFLEALREEQFNRRYFAEMPLSAIQQAIEGWRWSEANTAAGQYH